MLVFLHNVNFMWVSIHKLVFPLYWYACKSFSFRHVGNPAQTVLSVMLVYLHCVNIVTLLM